MGPLQPVDAILHKQFNPFYHPMSSGADNGGISLGVYDTSQELEVQIQIGSRLFPEYPIRSVSESFYQLLKCMGILNSSFHSIDINSKNYYTYKYIVGIDLEKVLEAGYTGLSTKAGDLMTIKTKCLSPDTAATADVHANMFNATQMHVILHADAILQISDNGVSVFE